MLIRAAATAMVASDDEAPALFGAALALPGIEEWPFELARVQLAHGERLRRLRRTRDARSQLAAARDGDLSIAGVQPDDDGCRGRLRSAIVADSMA